MRLALLGAGNVGSTLGLRWAALGHTITFGVRQPQNKKYATLNRGGAVTIASIADACEQADVIVVAVPWNEAATMLQSLGDLQDKIIVDCTNPVDFSGGEVTIVDFGGLSHAQVLSKASRGGRFVKSLNQVGAHIMSDPTQAAFPALMYVAGDDAAAKQVVIKLTSELGFDARDAGPIRNARALEYLALLFLDQAGRGPFGRNFVHSIAQWKSTA